MLPVKVIHLVKRVEQIDREIAELHHLVDGIDSGRSYRNTMKIAAEQQINNLVGEKVKLMELKIENPPDFLQKHVNETEEKKTPQPRVDLESLLGTSTSTYAAARHEVQLADEPVPINVNPLKNFARMMNVDEILPRGNADTQLRQRRNDKPQAKTRAEILRDLPPLQY
jgi:hypothetical protein